MKRSTERILTSHVGSLPRPADLRALFARGAEGDELSSGLRSAVAEVVGQQRDAGIDIINDGEFGKPMSGEIDYGAWAFYHLGRLSGFERELMDMPENHGKDFEEFADFYASSEFEPMDDSGQLNIGISVAPISYTGHDQVQRDIDDLKAALNGDAGNGFITAIAPVMASWGPSKYYESPEVELMALAEAMREEYKAITDAGLVVQLDDPILVNHYEFVFSEGGDIKEFKKWADAHTELINHSLEGIPEEQVRYHVCWGSWKGPHSSDLPVKEVIDQIFKVNAQAYSVEAANPQHEHEWKTWRDAKLPDGKIVLPGVVTHKTNVLEHPETVADRIVNYAEAVGRENVIASTDCGMGGRLNPHLAWAKLKSLSEGAALASERLWG